MIPKRLSYFNDALALTKVDFPIYYMETISERHFIIAGGGGSSKTGVHNQINIFELVPTGSGCAANLVSRYETPDNIPDAIMSGSLMRDLPIVETNLVAAGRVAAIYKIRFDQYNKSFFINDCDTLTNIDEPEIKCVKCIPGKIVAGDSKGYLKIIDSETKEITNQIEAHNGKEINEIDVNLETQHIATLSRDEGRLRIWDLTDLKQIKEFKRETSSNFRSCRYVADSLLVAYNPVPAKGASQIQKWRCSDYQPVLVKSVTDNGIMAMTVSQDGNHVAIGTRSGGVSIFTVKNLSQIYNIDDAHYESIVTRLEFLPPKPEALHLTNSQQCPLLSVSIDRRIVLHRPRKGSFLLSLLKISFMLLVIYVVFFALRNYVVENEQLAGNSTSSNETTEN